MQEDHYSKNDHVHGRNYADDAGKPVALKSARRVWRGAHEKGQDMYLVGCLPYFWGTLKEECCGQIIFSTGIEAKTAVFEYIEVYYNRRRRHSSLGYVSPVDYEIQGEQRKEGSLDKCLFL